MSLIEINQLTKYFKEKKALDGLSLEVKKGEIFGLLGPNGAGKTTTIRILLGLIKPDSGSSFIDGLNCLTQSGLIRREVGFLLESPGLYENLSALYNLKLYARLYHLDSLTSNERIEHLLKSVGLWQRREERVGKWSKGMKQRLSLIRAFLHNPGVLLLDEPASGLDPASRRKIRETICRLAKEEGKTILMPTHNLEDAEKICDRVAFIKEGSLVIAGRPQDLRKSLAKPSFGITVKGISQVLLSKIKTFRYLVSLEEEGSRLNVRLTEEEAISQLIKDLVKEGVEIFQVEKIRPGFEEVYLRLVGDEEYE